MANDEREKSVLVVDDQRPVVDMMVTILRGEGFTARGMCDPREAVREILTRRPRPDVVVLDLVMPGISGMEIMRAIRTDTNDPFRGGILVVTQYPDAFRAALRSKEENKQLFDDFLEKPFDLDELVAKVRGLVPK